MYRLLLTQTCSYRVLSCTVPDMSRRLIPLLDRVLVQKVAAPEKSIGGVLLPETASKVCGLIDIGCDTHVAFSHILRQSACDRWCWPSRSLVHVSESSTHSQQAFDGHL